MTPAEFKSLLTTLDTLSLEEKEAICVRLADELTETTTLKPGSECPLCGQSIEV